jgi:hypothetical protein
MLNTPGLELPPSPETAKKYFHHPSLLSSDEASKLYDALMKKSWNPSVTSSNFGGYYLAYGTPYNGRNSKERKEVAGPISESWQRLADKVSKVSQSPVNYIQCHLFAPGHAVHPHFDPGGMIVPMLTIGQERTFRVGGKCPQCYPGTKDYVLEQENRDVSSHGPADEYLMKHGDLLVFIGGNVLHSMFPASQDGQFNQNGCDWRISIIFRWTPPLMAKYGAGNKEHKAAMKAEYQEALEQWRKSQKPQ